MKKIIFATHNSGKIKEMKDILSGIDWEILSADEVGVTEDVIEDGLTFIENAYKKAKFVVEKSGEWAIADDSGIMIDALNGAPGVYSARWAGEGASAEEIVGHTLKKMEGVEPDKRTATFVSAVVLCGPNGERYDFVGEVKGKVLNDPRGQMRPKLPYDVIFELEEMNKTFAELSDGEKNRISHRGRAFAKVKEFLGSLTK